MVVRWPWRPAGDGQLPGTSPSRLGPLPACALQVLWIAPLATVRATSLRHGSGVASRTRGGTPGRIPDATGPNVSSRRHLIRNGSNVAFTLVRDPYTYTMGPTPKSSTRFVLETYPFGHAHSPNAEGGGGDDYLPSFGRSIRLPTFGGRNHALAHRADRLRHHPRATPRELPLAPHGMAPPAAFTRHGQSATMGWPKLVPTDPNSQA